MGVDFIRKKVSDHRKKYAAMAPTGSQDLFVDPAARATQVVRASTSADDPLQIGDCVIVRRDDSGSIVASKDTRVVARFLDGEEEDDQCCAFLSRQSRQPRDRPTAWRQSA